MKYELSFIISSVLPETEHEALHKEVLSYLDKIKAKTSKEFNSLGRKKLAYTIKKQKHGFYVFLNFELEETAGLKSLDTDLRHNNNILRHLIIKLIKENKPKKQTIKSKVEIKTKVAEPSMEIKLDDPSQKSKAWDDLDKKLDAILEDDSKFE